MGVTEGLQLRFKDVDFAHRALMVREGKGGEDRVVMLPDALVAEQVAPAWPACGSTSAQVPTAWRQLGVVRVFPQDQHSTDPRSGEVSRHLYAETFQRALLSAEVATPATPHTLLHYLATHMLQAGSTASGRCMNFSAKPTWPLP
jgi:site-specific recombinase XerD